MSKVLRRDVLRIAAALGLVALSQTADAQPAQQSPGSIPSGGSADLDVVAIRAMCRGLVPISKLADSVYDSVVARWQQAASSDPMLTDHLSQAAAALRRGFGSAIPPADGAEFAAFLATVQDAAFFAALLAALTPVIVTLPAVWEVAGYEGESFSRGGYLLHGFNDLDWLPDPPSTAMGARP